ncbi:phospholipase C/P1 nuclease family protein [Candidatus Contubernalis alkaliaceticus]|uniref:hypothetical protein n=1 Tax=Candidatus Contubernalis alkaliaceticus TaxID=338645 RepID=UPI001F4C3040|nr:hypothetical protein [Candidatus Contubernalis alkalaceticus]UNC93481.1 hypothetical protein HUE98_16190 [Candidatus Contubernalis alkalaceticus]
MNLKQVIRPLFKIENHIELVYETSLILKNDGREDLYYFIHSTDKERGKTYRELLEQGARNADIPFSGGYIFQLFHFHHPWTHGGYLLSHSSADVTVNIFTLALNLWKAGDKAEAIYQLGRSLHLVQDIFIPQHSGVTAFNGHGPLEKWLAKNWKTYQVTGGGYYHWDKTFTSEDGTRHQLDSKNPYDWIDFGSHLSYAWYNRYFRHKKYNEDTFHKVAAKIIPHALRHSAGYINKFFYEAKK